MSEIAKRDRLIQPEALRGDEPWPWSPGAGKDVWAMFLACAAGDLGAVTRLVERDPSLVRAHYEYRTPLSFDVQVSRLRKRIDERLLELRGSTSSGDVLSLDDARLLVARLEGFASWDDLASPVPTRVNDGA
jgi:hypothetical protein